jgi:antitoxin HigA-1
MPMKNPVHPGALAKANLDELNLSVAEAARAMKIPRQQLHNVMQGRSAVTPGMALRFEKAFGATPTCGCECRPPMTLLKPESTSAK